MFERIIKGMIELRKLNDCESFHQKNERANIQSDIEYMESIENYIHRNDKKYNLK